MTRHFSASPWGECATFHNVANPRGAKARSPVAASAGSGSGSIRAMVLSTLACGAALWPTAATSAATSEGVSESTPGKVEVLVVTAERRTENLQTAPVAASVLTSDALAARNILNVDDLEFATPSLTIASNGQSNQMNIRGIGKEDNSGTATSAVATYRDGVGTVSGFFNGEPYYDLASVEVLRGPQGTFVGENAAGGAIFVNSRDPEVGGKYDGYIRGGLGDYSQQSLEGAVNLPLSDTFAARVAFYHLARDSYYDVYMDQAATIRNPRVNDIDYNSWRVGLRWQPNETWDVKLKFDYNNIDNHGFAFGIVPGWPNPTGWGFFGYPEATNLSANPYKIGNNATDNYARDLIQRGVLDVRHTFANDLMVRSISGVQDVDSYIRNDDDGSAVMDRRQHIRAKFRIYTQEFSLISPAENRFNWIVGAYYRDETLDFPNNDGFVLTDADHYSAPPFDFSPPGVPYEEITLPWHTPRQTAAGFGQVSYGLTDALTLQVGLRYQYYKVSEDAELGLGFIAPGFVLPDNAHYSEKATTGKVALNWQASDNNYFYAFVATGNTTGGVSVVVFNKDFKNQDTIDYEAGWKGTLFDGHLLTQIGGFYNELDHYQAYFVDALSGTGTYQNLDGTSKVYGMEATAQSVFGRFSFDTGAAWIHSELGSALIFDDVLGTDIDTDGKRQPYTPQYTLFAGAQYEFQLPGGATLTPRVDYAWIDMQTTTPLNRVANGVHIDRIDSHHQLNGRLAFELRNWEVYAVITNATNEKYIEAHGGPGYNAYPTPPRNYSINVNYRF
jgi:iron complex outermembrane recepter protein